MKIHRKPLNARWYKPNDEEELAFKIRPFPRSHTMLNTSGAGKNSEAFWEIFNFSVVDWKGITDEKGEPLECNEENKKLVFGYSIESMLFVSNKSAEAAKSVVEKKTS